MPFSTVSFDVGTLNSLAVRSNRMRSASAPAGRGAWLGFTVLALPTLLMSMVMTIL